MRLSLLAVASAAGVIFSSAAFAQAPTQVTPVDWTGFYTGVFGGAAWGNIHGSSSGTTTGCWEYPWDCEGGGGEVDYGDFDNHEANFYGGFQAGFDWQHRNFVFGIVGDIGKTHIQGSNEFEFDPYPNECQAPAILECDFAKLDESSEAYGEFSANLDWLATLRAKLGYATGPFLFYLTGGLAWGEIEADVRIESPMIYETSSPLIGSGCDYRGTVCDHDEDSAFGYAVGVGAAANLSRHMFAEFTYLYVNLNDAEFDFDFGEGGPVTMGSADATVDLHTVRAALNWRF